MFFKHEAYRNEKEYRFQQLFVSRPAPAVKILDGEARLWCATGNSTWRKLAPGSLRGSSSVPPPTERRPAVREGLPHSVPSSAGQGGARVFENFSFRSPVPRASPQGRP